MAVAVAMGVAAAAVGAEAEAAGRGPLETELARLSQALDNAVAAPLPEALAGQVEPQRQALTAARESASPALLLHRLSEAAVGVETLAFVAAHPRIGDLAAFEALWREREPRFAAAAPRPPLPPLAVALADAAENRAQKLYRASLPYARATQPLFGLYYLAQAEGELAYRDLVVRLAAELGGEAAPPPERARVEAALVALDAETLDAFAADPGGRGMVPVSARLKEARELLDGGRLEAAALTLLDARLALGRQTAAARADAAPAGDAAHAAPGAVAQPAREAAADPLPPAGSLAAPFVALAEETDDALARDVLRRQVLPLARTLAPPAPPGGRR